MKLHSAPDASRGQEDLLLLDRLYRIRGRSVKTFNDRVIPRSSVSLERAVCQRAGVAPKWDGALAGDC